MWSTTSSWSKRRRLALCRPVPVGRLVLGWVCVVVALVGRTSEVDAGMWQLDQVQKLSPQSMGLGEPGWATGSEESGWAAGLEEPGRSTEQLAPDNFLVGIARVGARLANGTRCGHELEQLLKAIADGEFWSLKVLDSFGQAPRTFAWGNYFWFAAPELCEDLNAPFRITFSDRQTSARLFNVTSPFPLRSSMVYFRFATPHYIDLKLPFENLIHLGLCLPRSCDSGSVFRYSDAYFQSRVFETQRRFELEMKAVDIKNPEFSWSFFKQTGSIIFISICLLVISLNIMAELLYKSKTNLRLQSQLHRKSTPTTPEVGAASDATAEPSSCFEEVLLCFRWTENWSRVTRVDRSDNFLGVIAGLRTVICLWVTVFHVYYYSLFAMTNTPMIFAKLENLILQPVMQSCFYVDVFFVISAFLLVYNFLSNDRHMRSIRGNGHSANLRLFGKAILHRYLRLTPIMVITMLLGDMVYDFLNMMSPFRLDVNSGIYCKDNWWYNLLYIHNFLDMKDICCSWTWYLGCEMQFFVLFTALLFIYAKNERLAKGLYGLLAVGLVLTSFLCNYYNNITFQIDVVYSTLDQLYVKPWVRVMPYLGGAALGWLMHRNRDRGASSKVEGRWWTGWFWLCCGCVYAATNFMTYWRATPTWLVATIMSVGKLLFALCVGAVIVMCAWGRGGSFNRLMSSRPFVLLNKFSYSIYMVAPTIVFTTFGLRMEATHFSEVGSGIDFIGVILMATAAAILMVMLVELPMQRVSGRFVKSSQ